PSSHGMHPTRPSTPTRRSADLKQGEADLRANTVDADKGSEEPLLDSVEEAVERHIVFADGEVGVQRDLCADFRARDYAGGRVHEVTHAPDIDDERVGGALQDGAGQSGDQRGVPLRAAAAKLIG